MSVADFCAQPVAGPYLLGPDGRLVPVDRKQDLRNRIRAVLRDQKVVTEVSRNVANRTDAGVPLWVAAFDAEDEVEIETTQV